MTTKTAESAQSTDRTAYAALAEAQQRRQPRVDFWSALRRHWILATLPVIILVGAAIGAAYEVRDPVYTAESRMSVGRLDASAPEALAGFTGASSSLAETYSRSIRSDAIVASVAAQAGRSREFVKSRLSAAPIPETPVFTVMADASSPETAVKLAVLAGRALEHHAARLGRSTPNADRVLHEYRAASAARARASLTLAAARRAYDHRRTSATRQRIVAAEARLADAKARAEASRTAYVSGRQGQGSAALIEMIERPTSAEGDRGRVLQLWLFAAVLAGLAIGAGLALLRARRLAAS